MSDGKQEPPEARASILAAVRELERLGFNHGSSGNISVRSDDGLLITPTGARSVTLTTADVVAMTIEGHVIGAGKPSSEWRMHTAILHAFPSINAVVHTHSDYCVAISSLRESIPPFHYMVASFGGDDVRCADYAPFGSAELAQSCVDALEGRTACLLANHGMLVVGETLAKAMDHAVKLETLARQYVLALQCGRPVLLNGVDMAEVHERYRTYKTK